MPVTTSLPRSRACTGGRLGDRRGTIRVFTLGVAAFLPAYLGFAFTDASILILAGSFTVAGIGIGFAETAEHAAVATHAQDNVRGSAFGLLAATQSFGNLAASAVAGALWTLWSPTAAFLFLAAAMVISLASLTLTRDRGSAGRG
jgi:MFS family permease